MKNLLVTGGAGFIGANFILYMLEKYTDISILNLDKLTYAANLTPLASLSSNSAYTFIEGDICDKARIGALLSEYRVDTIVHFAAESHVDRSILGAEIFVRTNVMGTFNLLECAREYWKKNDMLGSARFHHISTDEVYGSLDSIESAPFTEYSQYAPNSPYSASKAASDHLVRSYFKTYGLPVTTSNCSNNYGPYQHSEKLIPKVIELLEKGETIPVYGDGSNVRDWLYVKDHCSAIDLILSKGQLGEVYNVGGGTELSNLDLVKTLCTLYEEKTGANNTLDLIHFVTDRKGHDWRYAINSLKLTQELDWKPEVEFSVGLNQVLNEYLSPKKKG